MTELGGRLLRSCERRLRAHREIPTWFDSGHVLLASYPKSGNTWLRFIISNLSRELGRHTEPVDFHSVARYVPEIRRNRGLEGRIETGGFPLFLKTHFPYIHHFSAYRSVVIIRDPADTLVSYHGHLGQAAGKRLPDLERFVMHWRYGIRAWSEWYAGWVDHANCVVRYEDLLVDPVQQAMEFLESVGVSVERQAVELAVARSGKEEMRKAQRMRGDPHPKNPDYEFVGKARAGTARELLSRDALDAIYEAAGDVATRFGYGSGSSAATGRAPQ